MDECTCCCCRLVLFSQGKNCYRWNLCVVFVTVTVTVTATVATVATSLFSVALQKAIKNLAFAFLLSYSIDMELVGSVVGRSLLFKIQSSHWIQLRKKLFPVVRCLFFFCPSHTFSLGPVAFGLFRNCCRSSSAHSVCLCLFLCVCVRV